MPGPSRRDFLTRTAGFLAAAAVAKLPVIPEPEPEIIPVTIAPHTPPVLVTAERDDVVTFKVFGRSTVYALPGVRR